jgi:glycosyltransferase involved in cell wall biosynthesis
MHLALLIYGSLDSLSGGYLYDRKLVEFLRARGDTVEIISLPWRSYPAHLLDNLTFRLPSHLDLLIQDELNHPSLLFANSRPHSYPIVSLVHHLRSSELRPFWQNRLYRLVETQYLRSVDGFIFNSRTTQAEVRRLAGSDKPHIVAYPPTDRFSPTLTEDEIVQRAQTGELRIVFLGSVIYRKGLHTLLEALRLQTSGMSLDIVGSLSAEPKYARAMQRQASTTTNYASRISFHGPLEKDRLAERLRQSHVLVVPSSYEGFGIVYLEGMGFGLPAIGTTAGAAREIITGGVDGFLVEPGDHGALAGRLGLLARDRELLVRMSLAARQRYLRQPSWTRTAAALRQFLQDMLASP